MNQVPSRSPELPVVVIGAGPVGLAAAAHLVEREQPFVLLETAAGPGAHVAEWGHVRMFTPWRSVVDPAAGRLLERHGWTPPPEAERPTGEELLRLYLEPLARIPDLASRIAFDRHVTAVGKLGFDRMKDGARDAAPFDVRFAENGEETRMLARAVIDASGTWVHPNPIGSGGLPAVGEGAARDRIVYGIPDVLGSDRHRFADKRVLVVGGGDSAFQALTDLARLARERPQTEILWGIRDAAPSFGGGAADRLPERGALGQSVRALASGGAVRLVPGIRIEGIEQQDGRLRLHDPGLTLEDVDVVVAATGFRPDHELARELRLALHPGTESAAALGPLIDPHLHSCGTVPPHGVEELSHPDAGYYIVGMKSYGRAPTFLLLTGYEQVRSVVAEIAGDREAARQVRLVLPETGVCTSTSPVPPSVEPVSEIGCCEGCQ